MEASVINIDDIISWEEIPYKTTYDIEVENNHNFYLATSCMPILVHNSGKSEFTDYVLTRSAIGHNWKFGVCSFENQPSALHVTKLMEKMAGKAFGYRENINNRIAGKDFEKVFDLVNEYFFFINIGEVDITLTGILDKAKELVVRKGINGLLIDPWNYIEHNIPAGLTETQYISKCLTELKSFAIQMGVHIFLIAHPAKLPKENGKYVIPTLYNISGSAHFFNKTDNGITVYRHFDTNKVEIHIQKVRFSWLGKIGMCEFTYNVETRQYEPIGQPHITEAQNIEPFKPYAGFQQNNNLPPAEFWNND